MTFVPVRLAGDRITLKDGSHWTIRECFGRTGIDDYYDVDNGERSRFVYADEIASPAPMMRGGQSIGRIFRTPPPHRNDPEAVGETRRVIGRPTLAEWLARYDAVQAARGDGRLTCALEGRPYQEAAMRTLAEDAFGAGPVFRLGLGTGKAGR